jgi:hypothetical protein
MRRDDALYTTPKLRLVHEINARRWLPGGIGDLGPTEQRLSAFHAAEVARLWINAEIQVPAKSARTTIDSAGPYRDSAVSTVLLARGKVNRETPSTSFRMLNSISSHRGTPKSFIYLSSCALWIGWAASTDLTWIKRQSCTSKSNLSASSRLTPFPQSFNVHDNVGKFGHGGWGLGCDDRLVARPPARDATKVQDLDIHNLPLRLRLRRSAASRPCTPGDARR